MGDKYDLWERQEVWENLRVFKPVWDTAPGLIGMKSSERAASTNLTMSILTTGVLGQFGEPFGNGAVLGPANMYTYRTKDFMISSVQDYKGKILSVHRCIDSVARWRFISPDLVKTGEI